MAYEQRTVTISAHADTNNTITVNGIHSNLADLPASQQSTVALEMAKAAFAALQEELATGYDIVLYNVTRSTDTRTYRAERKI